MAKRKAGKAAAEAALDSLARREIASSNTSSSDEGLDGGPVARIKQDIEVFFVGLESRIGVLVSLFYPDYRARETETVQKRQILPSLSPDAPREDANASDKIEIIPPSDPADPSLEALAQLSTDFHQVESNLYDVLAATPIGQLNDARRHISTAIKSATGKLLAWQNKFGIDHDFAASPLELPEYAKDSKVHALPGSSVLVREDEPSSIIAYTLS